MSETDTVVYVTFGDGKAEPPPPLPPIMEGLETRGELAAEFASWIVGLATHTDVRVRDRAERWQNKIAQIVGKSVPPEDTPA